MLRLFTLFALLSVLFLSGCTYKKRFGGEWEVKIDSPEMTYLVVNYAEAMKHEFAMELEDSKVCYDASIEQIILQFKSQKIVDMCEARKILVDMVEDFLDRVNHHALLGFELKRNFSADDLSVTIDYESFFTQYVDPLQVGVVCLRDGTVSYFAGNIKNWHADWSDQRIEPYFKSLEIVQAQRAAELHYAEKRPKEVETQPHPFIFGKSVPIRNGNHSASNGSGIITEDLDTEIFLPATIGTGSY